MFEPARILLEEGLMFPQTDFFMPLNNVYYMEAFCEQVLVSIPIKSDKLKFNEPVEMLGTFYYH